MAKSLLLVLAVVATALAGCSDDGKSPVPDGSPPAEEDLASGKGAIEGLLVDDRFRPIADGTILLQPLGQRAESNGNGEFLFLDLEPGAYTIKVSAEGHEASPQTINVAEGEFAEANVVARRVINEGSTILTREFGIFAACWVEAVVIATAQACGTDFSGDSSRLGFVADYTSEDNITVLVTEFKMENPGDYAMVIRDGESFGTYYAEGNLFDGDYIKITNWLGVLNEEYNSEGRNVPWNNSLPFQSAVFPHGEFYQESNDATGYWGAGAGFGIKGKIIQSVFIGEPEVDIAGYCVLC